MELIFHAPAAGVPESDGVGCDMSAPSILELTEPAAAGSPAKESGHNIKRFSPEINRKDGSSG